MPKLRPALVCRLPTCRCCCPQPRLATWPCCCRAATQTRPGRWGGGASVGLGFRQHAGCSGGPRPAPLSPPNLSLSRPHPPHSPFTSPVLPVVCAPSLPLPGTEQTEFGANQVVLRRTLASPVPHFLAKIDAVVMTIPQAKGLEFNGAGQGPGEGPAAQAALTFALPRGQHR